MGRKGRTPRLVPYLRLSPNNHLRLNEPDYNRILNPNLEVWNEPNKSRWLSPPENHYILSVRFFFLFFFVVFTGILSVDVLCKMATTPRDTHIILLESLIIVWVWLVKNKKKIKMFHLFYKKVAFIILQALNCV